MLINVCVRGSHDWLFGDLRERLQRTNVSGVRVIASEEPVRDADGWVFIRTGELALSPDLSRTVVCIHDLYSHDEMYAPGGSRGCIRQAGGVVLCHPQQRVILNDAGISLAGKLTLERPMGALEIFTVRQQRPEVFTIGWVGRGHWRKRPEFVLETLNHFQEVCPGFRIMLIGKDLETLDEQLCAAGIDCALHDRSVTSIGDYPQLYQNLDCLLITSCTEAGPLPLFEALASGLPVVSTPVGWSPHFAALEPSFVKLGEGPAELASALIEIKHDCEWLFDARHRIAALAATPRLDSWFTEVLELSARVVRIGL